LGLESEWTDSGNGIRADFSRLLATKAPIKIMLFETGKRRPTQEIVEDLNQLGRTWCQHSEGDFIYAIDFSHGNHSTFFYHVTTQGRDAHFTLEPIAELTRRDAGAS
jgi:hypothetical protein